MNTNKNEIIIFSIVTLLSILFIIGYGLYHNKSNEYKKIKINQSKQLVYTKTKYEVENYNQYIPYLNIQGETGTIVNNEIQEYIKQYNKDNIGITYEYNVNGKVLSLVIKIEDHSYVESATLLHFKTFNIKLDTKELLSNDQILKYFNLNYYDIQNMLSEKIKNYYNELVNNNIINRNDCNYECFLNNRNLLNNINDIEYYIRQGNLIIFKPYTFIPFSKEDIIIYDFQITNN